MFKKILFKIALRIIKICEANKPAKKVIYFDLDTSYNKQPTKKYKVIGVTPAGRKRYLKILIPHLLNQRHVLDKHIFWLNTTNEEDVSYIKAQCQAFPDFFSYQESLVPINGNKSIAHFFEKCVNPDAIYVRFDDDICWIESNAVEELVKFRIQNPEYFLVFGNIINNSLCNFIHQRIGCLSLNAGEKQNLKYDCTDQESWGNGKTAAEIHKYFLENLASSSVGKYFFNRWVLKDYERFSINFMAFFGSDMAKFGGVVGVVGDSIMEEEPWLTEYKPMMEHRPNCICGTSLVAHFAFYTQREFLENQTDILQQYLKLAVKNV